ncbi:MAG: DUF1214 domain-containing protein [Myxococcota bacterium]
MSARDPTRRVVDGRSWAEFCEALRRAGEVVLREGSPKDPLDRAEGYRYLGRLSRSALEAFLDGADPKAPVLRRPAHETLKLGADNPDNRYESATISGRYEYQLHGTRGSVHYLGFGTYLGSYGSGERTGTSGYLEATDLEIDPDGRFEILLSCARKPGNWLPMEPETSLLIVRQTFLDRKRERAATLSLERLGASGPPAPLSAEQIDTGLARAGAWVQGTAELFADWAESFARQPNRLPLFDPERARAAHGDPHIAYFHGYWVLAEHEALVIEVEPPPCEYWNFQLNNHWMESLDYRYHRISLNHHQARYRSDGSVRIVVAHRDPGVENWLETAGHTRGTMCLRWIRAHEHPEPRTRVVPWAELRSR